MNPNIIAGLLKRVYPDFDMLSFENRFKLQKFVYLLKAWGIELGYDFSLYLYGPYSTELANDGFEIKDFESIHEIAFDDKSCEKKFEEFKIFYESYKKDLDKLEIASSIHLIKQVYNKTNKEDIIRIIKEKRDNINLDLDKFEEVYKDLVDRRVING